MNAGHQASGRPGGRMPGRCLATIVMVTLFLGAESAAGADGVWPTRPVRLVVPIASGGGVDTIARGLAAELAPRLGQSIVVDNRAGAGGSLGAELVARAAPDGHTLLIAGSSFVLYTLLHRARYDVEKDFSTVTQLVEHPYLMLISATLPAATLKEFMAIARGAVEPMSFASSGEGSLIHLLGELFKRTVGADMAHVPYKGLNMALPDLFAGRVHMTFSSALTAMPHVRSGRLRAIGVTSAQRLGAHPDIPTLEEGGLPGFEATQWYGVFAPAGAPKPVIARLQREVSEVLKSSAMAQRFAFEGLHPVGNAPAAFSSNIRRETARWGELVEKLKLRAQ